MRRYRSDDAGRRWQETTAGLPTDFGFAMAVHPHDPRTVWTVPLSTPEHGRYMPDGRAAVWVSDDEGASWQDQREGLPQSGAYLGVLRDAMATDRHDPVGVYFGTSTGQLFGSRDEGRSWGLLADFLPGISSVEVLELDTRSPRGRRSHRPWPRCTCRARLPRSSRACPDTGVWMPRTWRRSSV